MRIALVVEALAAGARPDELDAIVQRREFERELRAAGHDCSVLTAGLDLASLARELEALRPALAVNLVETLGGSGRLAHFVPALLESLGIPHTGAPAVAILETTDKLHCKRRLLDAGLPTPAWLDANGAAFGDIESHAAFIVKPICEDASVGIDDAAVVCDAAAARARLRAAGSPSFAEQFVAGREFNLALLEKDGDAELLPAAEIEFHAWPADKPRIVGYAAKWDEASFEFGHTPRRFDFARDDAALIARLGSLAHVSWKAFALRGYARVDFRVDAAGRPWILEVNANPCVSPDAGFSAAAARAGIDAAQLVARIASAALASAER